MRLAGGKVRLLIRPNKQPEPHATALTRASPVLEEMDLPKHPPATWRALHQALALYVYITRAVRLY